jgi:hypothetical protein
MTSLEVYAGGDRQTLRELHVLANAPKLIPDSFKAGGKSDGAIDWGAVVLAGQACRRLGLDPLADLNRFPVVKGAVYPMAEIWRLMARRHGWLVTLPVDTPEKVIVDLLHRTTGEHPPPFEMTMDQARDLSTNRTAEGVKVNPLYQGIGGARAMLQARATMAAIRLNAPEVLRDPATQGWAVDPLPGQPLTPGQGTAAAIDPEPAPGLAAATIDPADIGLVATAVTVLTQTHPDLAARTRTRWKQQLPGVTIANIHTADQLTRAALLALEALLDALTDRLDPDRCPDDIDELDAGRPFEPDPDRKEDGSGGYRYDPEDGRPSLTGDQTDQVGW